MPEAAFDVVVVDEGQELANEAGLQLVDRILAEGLVRGSWRWFMDCDNQSLHKDVEPASINRLAELSTQWSPTHNVRSTREIVGLVQSALGADVGLSEIDGRGVRPRVEVLNSDDEAVAWAARYVLHQINSGVRPEQIVVLGAVENLQRIREGLSALNDRDVIVVRGPTELKAMQTRLAMAASSFVDDAGIAWGEPDLAGSECRVQLLFCPFRYIQRSDKSAGRPSNA